MSRTRFFTLTFALVWAIVAVPFIAYHLALTTNIGGEFTGAVSLMAAAASLELYIVSLVIKAQEDFLESGRGEPSPRQLAILQQKTIDRNRLLEAGVETEAAN